MWDQYGQTIKLETCIGVWVKLNSKRAGKVIRFVTEQTHKVLRNRQDNTNKPPSGNKSSNGTIEVTPKSPPTGETIDTSKQHSQGQHMNQRPKHYSMYKQV
jgi:hypothetical protein